MFADTPIMAFVATARPAEAQQFYAEVLGLRLTHTDEYALTFDAGGTMLRVARVQEVQPVGYTVLGWIVADIHAAIAQLTSRGVVFERFSFLPQDADGVWQSTSGAQVAWFKDPDGNTLSVTQM